MTPHTDIILWTDSPEQAVPLRKSFVAKERRCRILDAQMFTLNSCDPARFIAFVGNPALKEHIKAAYLRPEYVNNFGEPTFVNLGYDGEEVEETIELIKDEADTDPLENQLENLDIDALRALFQSSTGKKPRDSMKREALIAQLKVLQAGGTAAEDEDETPPVVEPPVVE